jgi:TonB-dependent starch-binding outer membrane protein SusC
LTTIYNTLWKYCWSPFVFILSLKTLKIMKCITVHQKNYVLKVMQRTAYIALAIINVSLWSFAENVRAQADLEKNVSITFKDVPLSDGLSLIENKTGVKFIYSNDLLPQDKKISIHAKNKPLKNVLIEMLDTYGLVCSQSNHNYIAIKKKMMVAPKATKKISGKVVDQVTGEPLIGVTIMVKDTKQGTSTDTEGKFTLEAEENSVLIFSYLGYEPLETSAIGTMELNIQLIPSLEKLSEVVVIGYGTQAKDKITGAVSQVKGEELNKYAASSFAQQLAGRTSGVLINDASAQPGTDPQIVIRGIGTLTAGRNPLIVVDGFPLSEGSSLNSVNPSDIATIDILKDPSSAAIYGSRAANGVILITTKKGGNQKLQVDFDTYTGFQERADNMELVDAYKAAEFFTTARDNNYVFASPTTRSASDNDATRMAKGANLRQRRLSYLQPYLDNQPGLTNTNWLNEIFRKATINNYNLSFKGGSNKSNYYVGLNYFNQQGIVINTGLERFSATIKAESELNDRFTFGVNVNPSYTTNNYFENNSNRDGDPISIALVMYPFFAPYNADGSLAMSQQIVANTPQDGALTENPVAIMKKTKFNRNNFRVFGNTFLTAKIIEGLNYKITVGGDFRNLFVDYYNPSDVGAYRTNVINKQATAQETNGNSINYLIENTLNYKKEVGNHSFDALAGFTFQKEDATSTVITGTTIPDNQIQNISGASSFTATSDRYTWSQISYLGRVQYAYQNKYLWSVASRFDASSKFGNNNKWGTFPSVTAGWIASREAFFPQNKVVTFAKLRATWGKSGNNQIGNYKSYSLVGSDNYVFGSSLASGFAANSGANPNLSWETKTSVDVGIDIGLFKKFNLTADYYNSLTTDLLLDVPVPQQSGYSTQTQNLGKVRNKGLEIELSGSEIKLGPVKWSFSGNFSTNQNTVEALGNGQDQIIANASNGIAVFRTKVGGPVAELYGYNVVGIYKSQEQIDNTPHLNATQIGNYIIQDVNGDGKIDDNDKIGYGTYMPKFNYGFSSNFAYNNFDLSFAFVGVAGRKIYDVSLLNTENGESFSMPTKYYYEHRYDPILNPNGNMALPNMANNSAMLTARASNMYFYDADYLRLRNIQLSYKLPEGLISKLAKGMKASLYVAANNLFTITPFRGFNPDATSDNALTSGSSYSNYPVARTYMLGLNLTF